ncbi:MAG TPA: sugar nucleotide-binding protein [Candidatus Nanoarchaeia archaeon]|nr:sugar nucleotide-binding protein [Candidatus Nanoarchaeia archaeon]
MVILITGASSYVGARIYADLKKIYPVIGTYHSSQLFPELEHLDITDKQEVERIILKKKPEWIIHVAANPSSSWCEQNPEEAIAINETGTKYVVDAANKINSKVIFISSFAVFKGKNRYSKTKIAAENIVKSAKNGYVILRPSLILGFSPNTSNDRQFNRFIRNIKDHVPAVYDTSWRFQATWLTHLVEVIEQIMEKNILNEIIPVSVPELKSRYDIAKDILSEFHINVTPEDKQDPEPIVSDNQQKLKELGLPLHNYREMITGITKELRQYLQKEQKIILSTSTPHTPPLQKR